MSAPYSSPRKRLAIAAIAAVAVLAPLTACAPGGEETEDREITFGLDASAFRGYIFGSATSEVLGVWRPEVQDFELHLAEDLTFSEDQQALTITLPEDVDFQDGEHLTADGVAGYFTALLTDPAYVYSANIASYEPKFEAVDEYVVEMTTSTPIYLPDFWNLLGTTPVLSSAALDDLATNLDAAGLTLQGAQSGFGSGPYVVDEVVTDSEITLVRNPDYRDPEAFPFDTVVLKLMDDPVSRLNALKSGQVDVAHITAEYASEAEGADLTIGEAPSYFPVLWTRDPVGSTLEPLRDERVRQAIMYAFDREGITETLDLGYGRVTSQAFEPGQAEYIEGGDDRYPFDLDEARELMADAGYADGFDVVIPTYPDAAKYQPIVEQSLADIGIRVTYEQFPDRATWYTAMGSGEFPLVLEPLQGAAWTLRSLIDDFGSYGRPFAPNAEIESLIASIKSGTPEESAEASQVIGEKLLEEAWYIPISRPARLWAMIPGIQLTLDPVAVTLPDQPALTDFEPVE